jgi:hypothetical protein
MDITDARRRQIGLSAFLSFNRPHSYWDVVGLHLPLALVTGIAILLAKTGTGGFLPIKRCTFLWLTGYPCPFCGFTRSFQAMAHGDWIFGAQNCPLACLLYIAVVFVFAWNMTGLLIGVRIVRGRLLRLRPGTGRRAAFFVGVLVVLNWIYRLSLGLR